MKKILLSFVMFLCLYGCKTDYLIHDLDSYLSDRGINDYTILIREEYNEEFEFAIAKANTPEKLYLSARTISEEGLFHEYSQGQRQPLFEFDEFFYYDYNSNYTECENSYFFCIVMYEIESVMYQDETIEFVTKEFDLNGEKKIISYWIYEYDNINIDENLFEIQSES